MQRHIHVSYVPWRLLGGLLFFALAFMIYYLIQIVPAGAPGYSEAGAYRTGLTIGAINALYAAGLGLLCLQRPHLCTSPSAFSFQRNGQRFSPFLLGTSLFCYAFSQVTWFCHILLIGHVPPYLPPAQLAGLGIYLPLISAILLLPTRNLAHWSSRLRIFLDALMIMVVVTTLCYYFLLAPLLVKGADLSLARSVSGAFLAADLALMFSLLLVALRPGERALRPVLIMLFFAILAVFITHVAHMYEVLYLGFNEFSRANAGLPLAGTLVVGAAGTTTNLVNTTAPEELAQPAWANQEQLPFVLWRWKSVLPPILVLMFSLLIFLTWLDGQTLAGHMTIVYAGGFVALILMVIRQILTLAQINALHRQLQSKNGALHSLNTQLEQLVATDPLTGLPNHRALVEKLDAALNAARARRATCAVIFTDIDQFKTINDHHGYATGDRVLCQFGELVQAILPAGACVGRWGDEEFVAILPSCDMLEALDIAEQIRARVEHSYRTIVPALSVTCSLGVASYPQDASTREELLIKADRAMYTAKCLGRNQVRIAHEPPVLATCTASSEPEAVEREETLVVVDTLLMLLEVRDPMLSQHARRVSALSLKLALLLDLSDSETYLVGLAGLLHDTGKVALPDHVLWQRDWPEDQAPRDMLQHPLIGTRILAPITTLQAVTAIVRTHHEHLDGSGYPHGLRGEEISLGARIVSVADAYDTLTSCCQLRPAQSSAEALGKLQREAGVQFDRRVVEALGLLLVPGARDQQQAGHKALSSQHSDRS